MKEKLKILICYENRVRVDTTGNYYLNALKSIGHKVDHVLPENIHSVAGGYDCYFKIDDGIYSPWNKNLKPATYIAIDCHIETDWRLKIAQEGEFERIGVVHSVGLDLPWGREVVFSPVGCDPDVHCVGLKEKTYDGCFIGNFHNNLAGPRVEMLDIFFKAAPNFFFGKRMFREMTEKYAQSKLCFNRSINGDLNMRAYEIMCSGSCLITDRVPDLDKLGFIDKGHYFGYSSAQELDDLTRMLLCEHSLRERVAQAGRQFVIEKHTYAHRMKDLLSKIQLHKQEKIPCPL